METIKEINSKIVKQLIEDLKLKGFELDQRILIKHESKAESIELIFENSKKDEISFEVGEDNDLITDFYTIDAENKALCISRTEVQLNSRIYETLEELFKEERF